jgi:hypothetical protein
VAPYLKLPVDSEAVNSVTRGLVGDSSFAVLPNISPRMTFVLTLAAQIVCFDVTAYIEALMLTMLSPLSSNSG